MSLINDLIWLNTAGDTSGYGYPYGSDTPINSATTYRAWSFYSYRTCSISKLVFYISTVTGSPANIEVLICGAGSSGKPDSANPITNGTIVITTPAVGWAECVFSTPPQLTANTQYFVVIKGNSTTDYISIYLPSQSVPPAFTMSCVSGFEDGTYYATTNGDSGWSPMAKNKQLGLRICTDGSWMGSPLHFVNTAAVLNSATDRLYGGNTFVWPVDAPLANLTAVAIGGRSASTTAGTELDIFENGNLISITPITGGSGIQYQYNEGRWGNRVFRLSRPVILRPGNTYFVGHKYNGATIDIGGFTVYDKQFIPLQSEQAFITSSGVLTPQTGKVCCMALGLDIANPFFTAPINRRTSTGR